MKSNFTPGCASAYFNSNIAVPAKWNCIGEAEGWLPCRSQTALGIYKLDGGKLTWCACEPGRGARPAEFATKGTDFLLVVMERAKK